MEPITTFRGKTVALPVANIDTDQIIPAVYLKATEKKGLGKALFATWRQDPAFALNQPGAKGASVLVAGDNFGCGSSREHAPWALADYGFRAIVSTSFADIFRNNCLKNGLLPVIVEAGFHREALEAAAGNVEMTVDLPAQTIALPSGRKEVFPIDAFSKRCLVQGVDELGYLLSHEAAIRAFEKSRA